MMGGSAHTITNIGWSVCWKNSIEVATVWSILWFGCMFGVCICAIDAVVESVSRRVFFFSVSQSIKRQQIIVDFDSRYQWFTAVCCPTFALITIVVLFPEQTALYTTLVNKYISCGLRKQQTVSSAALVDDWKCSQDLGSPERSNVATILIQWTH